MVKEIAVFNDKSGSELGLDDTASNNRVGWLIVIIDQCPKDYPAAQENRCVMDLSHTLSSCKDVQISAVYKVKRTQYALGPP